MFRFFGHGGKEEPPRLTEEDRTPGKKKIETLKAGMLAREALALTKTLVGRHPSRPAGEEESRATAHDLREAFSEFCPDADEEPVSLSVGAHHLPWKLVGFVYPVVLLLLWIGQPLPAILLYALFLWYAVRELLMAKPLWEPRQKKENGVNVTATLEPEGEARRTIIFSGHHDSAPLWRFSRDDSRMFFLRVTLPLGMLGLMALQCVSQLFAQLFTGTLFSIGLPPVSLLLYMVLLTAGLPFVWGLRDILSKDYAPGAGDNLLSSAVCVQLARYYDWKKKLGQPLEHTRLVFVSFDGEEAGLRGSRAWFEAHKASLGDGAVMVNMDCLYHAQALTFLSQDASGLQKLDEPLAEELCGIARQMGYEAKTASIPFLAGGTDAASGQRTGVPSTTMTAVAWGDRSKPDPSHSEADTVDAIDERVVERAIAIAIKFVSKQEERTSPAPGRS